MTKIAVLALCGVLVGLGTIAAMQAFGVLIVYTPSVPRGVYLRRSVAESVLRKGDTVCFDATSQFAPAGLREGVAASRYPAAWRGEPLVKHIAALGGAALAYEAGRGVVVDGMVLPSSRRKGVDLRGRPLPSPGVPAHVPDKHVWLTSEHVDGFDSRYFGPVDLRALTCVAEALWIF